MRRTLVAVALAACALPAFAQPGQGKGKQGPGGLAAPANPRAQAPIDMTGTWVALITEDWVNRMTIPPKNKGKANVDSIQGITQAARAAADAWDPAKDEASGNTCKAYGAAGLMRLPTRLQIDWADDTTLRIKTDAGTQTRLFHFTGDVTGAPSLQGFSKASWEGMGGGGRGGPPAGPAGAGRVRPGSMKAVTTNLTAGYLRRNGVPYSDKTVLTEHYDILHEPDGTQYLLISTVIEDPTNLSQPWHTSTHFKKEADASKFKPQPCSVR